jgi:hypothetical protein
VLFPGLPPTQRRYTGLAVNWEMPHWDLLPFGIQLLLLSTVSFLLITDSFC